MSDAIVVKALNDSLGTNDYKGVNNYLKGINDSLVSIATALDPSLDDNSEDIENVVTNYTINNQAIYDFDNNVNYTNDYTYTEMGTYDHPTSYTKYGKPNGANPNNIVAGTIELTDINMGKKWIYPIQDNETIYNVSPNGVSSYKIIKDNNVVSSGQLNPSGKVRTLYGTTLKNCRDLGGWNCDGGTVKYGKLFRTSELTGDSRPTEQITELEKSMFLNLLGIKCEIDLRDTSESGGTPTFDNSVEYIHQTMGAYSRVFLNDTEKTKIKIVLKKIMENAIKDMPTLFHCVAGADRTATVSWLLLALLGVSQSDCDKEYELTCLSGPTRFRNKDYATFNYLSGLYSYIMSLGKSSFKNNIIESFRIIGIDEGLINSFRKSMIDGNPSDISYDVPPMTITTNGTYDVSKVNQAIVNTPVPTGTFNITVNGEHNVAQYEKVNVNVQGGITPTGTINISENGTYNVTDKATAVVNVPVSAHTGTIYFDTSQSNITIDVGFTGCTKFALFSQNPPKDTNTTDCMCWNSSTGFSVWSRYRGTYNGSYGSDAGTITVSGSHVTINISQVNAVISRQTTYTWVAL